MSFAGCLFHGRRFLSQDEIETKEAKIEPIPLEQRSSFVQDAKMKDIATKEFIQDKQKTEKPKVIL